MGRPPVKEPKQQYTIMLKPSVVKQIDKIAEKVNLTRSQLMGNFIEFGLAETKGMERLGIIKAVSLARKMKGAFSNDKVSLEGIGEQEI